MSDSDEAGVSIKNRKKKEEKEETPSTEKLMKKLKRKLRKVEKLFPECKCFRLYLADSEYEEIENIQKRIKVFPVLLRK